MEINLFKVSIESLLSISEPYESNEYKLRPPNPEIYPWSPVDFRSKLKKGEFGNNIGIVWGTTRHNTEGCKHPGYISDSMYILEIIQQIYKINKNVDFKSFLDIDLVDGSIKKEYNDYNFIICGDGEVNCLVSMLMEYIKDAAVIKYDRPNGSFFGYKNHHEDQQKCDSKHNYNNYGVVQFLKNRWNYERFLICVGGVGPIGTIAGLKWLSNVLNDPTKMPNPFVIVKGLEKRYHKDFVGYEKHCEACSIIKQNENVFYEGKISNIEDCIPVWP